MPTKMHNDTILYGIGGSPGICIGRAYLVDNEGVDVLPTYAIEPKRLNEEIKRLTNAIKRIDQTLRVSAAEYVPAIRDVFDIIDEVKTRGR